MDARLPLAVLLVAGAAASPALAQCTVTPWQTVGGGVTAAGPVSTGRAIIAHGSRLELVNAPATGTPTVVTAREMPRNIKIIQSLSAFAYVSDGIRLYRFDSLNAATNPMRLTSTIQPPDIINGMINTGNYVYTWQHRTLRVFDFNVPSAPALVASLELPTFIASVTFANDRLFVSTSTGASGQVYAVDIASRANPILVRTLNTGGLGAASPINAFPSGSIVRLLLSHQESGLGSVIRVMDVGADTAPPVSRGSVFTPSGLIDLNSGRFAEGGNPARLWTLNVTNPDSPSASAVFTDAQSEWRSAASVNARMMFAGQEGGFTVVDNNQLTSRYATPPGRAQSVAFAPPVGGSADAYVADNIGGLQVLRMTGGASLSHIGGANDPDHPWYSLVGGGFAYTLGPAGAIRCWNISNPAAPTLRSTFTAPGQIRKMATAGSAVLAMSRFSTILNTETLDLIDFAPITPQVRASLPLLASEFTNRVVMTPNLVLRTQAGNLHVYTHGPSTVTLQSSTPLGFALSDAPMADNFAYALDTGGRVFTMDLTNPAAPVHVHDTPLPGGDGLYVAAAVSGDWLATVGPKVNFYNIANRANPVLVASADLACNATDVDASGTQFLVSAGTCGVLAFDPTRGVCYANCDCSTVAPALNVNDFVCFQSRFAAADPYGDCDRSGSLNVNDFVCFQNAFAAGCP